MFDNLIGAGRDPQHNGSVKTWAVSSPSGGEFNDGTGPESETNSTALDNNYRIVSVSVNIMPFPAVGDNSVDGFNFAIYIEGRPVAKYRLPNSTSSWNTIVSDFIPTDIFVSQNSTLEIRFGPDNADATGYNFLYKVTAYGIPY